jgi:iron(III) transport system ATP-binding protein
MTTGITLSGISKRFGSGDPVVSGVSLDIAPGELFFLLGPSGCGKTTLLRMIAGFIEPTAGTIRFGDRDVTRLPPNRRNTGMVFQSYALWPHMTVEANVAFGLSVRHVPADQRRRRIAEALELVRMAEFKARKPNQLSGGQQQRVALARALVIRPDVLLLDEPLSNLDAKLRIELRSEIRRICKEARSSTPETPGITTVYVTHDQKEALSMADRVAIMRAGRIEQIGPPRDLYRRPTSRFVAEFLGETNFIEGSHAGDDGPLLRITTPAGTLLASRLSSDLPHPPGRITCSVRPEAIVLSDVPTPDRGGNRISGRIAETVFLGELAQHVIEIPGLGPLRAAEVNPIAARPRGSSVTLCIAPEDVVLVSDQDSMP